MDALMRRISTINENFSIPTGTWTIVSQQCLKEECARILGIEVGQILTCLSQAAEYFKAAKFTPINIPDENKNLPDMNNNNIENEKNHELALVTLNEQQQTNRPAATVKSSINSENTINVKSLTNSENKSTNEESTICVQDSGLENDELDYNDIRSPTPVSINDPTEVPFYNPGATPPTNIYEHVPTPSYEPQNNRNEHVSTPYEPDININQHTPTPSCESQNNRNQDYIPTPKNELIVTKAKALLSTGSTPILPPAEREWSIVPEESIAITSSLLWPPHNWQTYNADQKRLATEYAAMRIEETINNKFTIMDRAILLHKYNFLSLPGAAGINLDLKGKSRILNFHVISNIATGKDQSSDEEKQGILNSFRPSQDLKDIITKINHVPLRLKNKK